MLVTFCDVHISRIKKLIHHAQGQKPSIKCALRDRGSKMMVVRTHTDYLFSIEDENVISSQCCTNFILPSKFWISIHDVAIVPLLINMKIKWSESVYIPFIFFKSVSNTIIRSKIKNLHWSNEVRMRWKPNKRTNLTTRPAVFLNPVTHWYENSASFLVHLKVSNIVKSGDPLKTAKRKIWNYMILKLKGTKNLF